jgi:hypothetical protein
MLQGSQSKTLQIPPLQRLKNPLSSNMDKCMKGPSVLYTYMCPIFTKPRVTNGDNAAGCDKAFDHWLTPMQNKYSRKRLKYEATTSVFLVLCLNVRDEPIVSVYKHLVVIALRAAEAQGTQT